jgi:hypothetical protein
VENGLATEQQIDAARRIRGDGPPGPTLRRGRPWPCEDSGDDQRFDVHAECRAEDTTATIDSCGDAGTELFDCIEMFYDDADTRRSAKSIEQRLNGARLTQRTNSDTRHVEIPADRRVRCDRRSETRESFLCHREDAPASGLDLRLCSAQADTASARGHVVG